MVSPAPAEEPAISEEQVVPVADYEAEDVVLENDKLKIVLANRGAVVKGITLKEFTDPRKYKGPGFDRPLEIVSSEYSREALIFADLAGNIPFESSCYEVQEKSESSVTFRQQFNNGLEIIKTYELSEKDYALDLSINLALTGDSSSPLKLAYLMTALQGISSEDTDNFGQDLEAVVALRTAKPQPTLRKKRLNKLRGKVDVTEDAPVLWLGAQNRYFACVLYPPSAQKTYTVTLQAVEIERPQGSAASGAASATMLNNVVCALESAEMEITPESPQELDFAFFVGPKRDDILLQFDGLAVLVHSGWLAGIRKLLLWLLRSLHKGVGNYGAAILILTLIVKVILFPLTRKQHTSMHKMQVLKPKLQELQQRYKSDRQRLSQEQMKLYREHGVNPMGGCLPLFLNIPVFIALFQTLRTAIELRQAPFVGWISDLASPDRALQFPAGFALPVLGSYLNVLPILMIAAMIFQQRMTPRAADAKESQQQQMFKFMPYFMGVLFYNMPSGLVLYWFTSTVLGIGEQYLTKKKLEDETSTAAPLETKRRTQSKRRRK